MWDDIQTGFKADLATYPQLVTLIKKGLANAALKKFHDEKGAPFAALQ